MKGTTHDFLRHLLRDHPSDEELLIICPDCERGGLRVKGFETHWRRIHGPKPTVHRKRSSVQESISSPTTSSITTDHQTSPSIPPDSSSNHPASPCHGETDPSPSVVDAPSDCVTNSCAPTLVEGLPPCLPLEAVVDPSSEVDNSTSISEPLSSAPAHEEIVDISCLDSHDVEVLTDKSHDDMLSYSDQFGEFSEARKKAAAEFLLSLKANCNINDTNVLKVMTETQTLIEFVFTAAVQKLSKLKTLSDEKEIKKVQREVCCVFDGLHSTHLQGEFFTKQLKVVPLRAVDLYALIKKAGEGTKRKVVIEPHKFYYASIEDVLGRLIAHPDFKKMTAEYADPDPNILDCYLKGSNAKNNVVLMLHPDALRVILYYDEIELATGLGSHASNQQKVGAFYFTLENIQPQYRSSLKSICLVGLVNYDFISQNLERYTTIILKRIALDLKKLENGCLINGNVVYATLISATGDHAGVHLMAGYKRGFTANRFCRWCNLTLEETHVCTKSDPNRRRTVEQYEAEIGEIERCKTLKQRDDKSTKYGINWRCALNELQSFHAVTSCPPDLMHTLFEGALSRAVRNIIIHCVSKLKIVTLPWLNSALSDFDYGFSEKADKPSPVKEAHLEKDGNLHQSSAQLWNLAVILPLVVGQYVPADDEHWEKLFFDLGNYSHNSCT